MARKTGCVPPVAVSPAELAGSGCGPQAAAHNVLPRRLRVRRHHAVVDDYSLKEISVLGERAHQPEAIYFTGGISQP